MIVLYSDLARTLVGSVRPTHWQRLEDSLAAAEGNWTNEHIIGERALAIHHRLRALIADVTTERIRAQIAESRRQSLATPEMAGNQSAATQ